ncbi:menaquinol-cytochrome c reductase iron-sulfur subunit precursor [Saccharopolyspora erythraea NRRL 2338]|uniref:Cytochrome bc1 complex Rieske iron-sulfur subunit n=2 Tax=Saccharopolyspora erythraea TaxID=1836 RepID=A4FAD0_SACEN|nr:ubiquinol-cytochrome c reductase iron-sulfur subunit [Saccharopolyspora erythraea]EQD86405.1 menaquinol-cytochrome C reductase iron-sulfur subunit [Saccharopolyspora erythraea D]PFG94791.1 menaquinol-cytochrome c reductase iron-sulfur subunit precursor [Saccharopolyspora erythraea NRRL 2338]QRK91508.1 Rieske 2Fe-2S domain-containing protein [Saccharopolyspora erythraea]CAM01005.1 probable ubiquinol-cytochrome c reductase iron-sulfur subunit [Saccharopolyspora erythraea NRRL 2338]
MSEQQKREYTEAELAEMSRDEKVRLGVELDDVELVEYRDRWPVKNTRAERRAERAVAAWFMLAGLSALAFLAAFIFWPWGYADPLTQPREYFIYSLYTPLVGTFLGLSVLAVGFGAVLYAKKFIPHEVAVQQRHDGHPSEEIDRQTAAALLADAGDRSGIARRSMIKRTAGFGAGALGLGAGVVAIGGFVRNPWANEGPDSLQHTPWMSENGEKVYLRRSTGNSHDISLVRPEDIDAGGFETVYPFRESERHDEHALSAAFRKGDAPVMLIRLRPGSAPIKRKGQEDFNYGDYYAYSKICTHVGCPTSLFEQQTGRLLCPCHQSQFDVVNTYAKPVFGPATRSLPQLPITVDEEGYFVAKHDFIEPVGPAYWERKA